MSEVSRTWAFRLRNRPRAGVLAGLLWTVGSVIRLAGLMALLLVAVAGLTVGVGYLLVHQIAGALHH
jgi:hypothetical protein